MIVAIVQARMGSTRLPGKVMKEVGGIPLLGYLIRRAGESRLLDKIIVATTDLPEDDCIVSFCRKSNIECFRGSSDDVLDRYYQCALRYHADVIVRLTADCPLGDPQIIDKTISAFLERKIDFAANNVPPETRKYPDGTDVEVFSMQALERAHKEATSQQDKEHVTFYFWRYNNGFSIFQVDNEQDYSKYRITVDYPEDFEVIDFILRKLHITGKFGYLKEIIDIIEANPHIYAKNSKFYFGMGWGNPPVPKRRNENDSGEGA